MKLNPIKNAIENEKPFIKIWYQNNFTSFIIKTEGTQHREQMFNIVWRISYQTTIIEA